MTELGRLLTFMYEEDRLTALDMYERMFNETTDEQGLLQLLVSPTRQAVVLARSYDAKERKQQIAHLEEGNVSDADAMPSFIYIIDQLAQQAAELGIRFDIVDEDQFSIFEDEAEAEYEEVAEEAAPVQAIEAEAAVEDIPADVEETADAVDAFLADFSVVNGELVSNKEECGQPEEEDKAEAEEESLQDESVEADAALEPAEPAEAEAPVEEAEEEPVYKTRTNILLLIVYVFLAIPLGATGICLLLIPAVISLALAVSFASVGFSFISACFGSFVVIADTMVVFGAGLAMAALALLFVWMFVWFLGGAVIAFIRGICKLGRKICCKEVAVK